VRSSIATIQVDSQHTLDHGGLARVWVREEVVRRTAMEAATSVLTRLRRRKRGAHLRNKTLEHGVGVGTRYSHDRGVPHLPSGDQARTKQQTDQLKIESAVCFKRTELLEVVKLPVLDVRLDRAVL
jgi:hypothetical protein